MGGCERRGWSHGQATLTPPAQHLSLGRAGQPGANNPRALAKTQSREQPPCEGLCCAKAVSKVDLPYLSTRGQRAALAALTPATAASAGAALSPMHGDR